MTDFVPAASHLPWSTPRFTANRHDVFVLLPPGYSKDEHRRYPIVYALHG